MSFYGLAASLQDAVALATHFGPGSRLGFGASQAANVDILVPTGLGLTEAETQAALKQHYPQYFFTFGNNQATIEPATIAPMINALAAQSGVGFMAACLANPAQGRTMYQGHLFEAGRLQGDIKRAFVTELDGGVGTVPHEIVTSGAVAIRRQCSALKEQGKTLALIDAINDDDCSAVAQAVAGLALVGGSAWLGERPHAKVPAGQAGPAVILSGALDRQTIFQIGAARGTLPVFDLNVGAPDAAEAALLWAADKIGKSPFIISSSVPPDKIIAGAPVTEVFASIAPKLAQAGVRRFVLTGNDCASAVLAALGIKQLVSDAAFGPLIWLKNETFSICVKPRGIGGKDLFLSDFEPQICLNATAE